VDSNHLGTRALRGWANHGPFANSAALSSASNTHGDSPWCDIIIIRADETLHPGRSA
jgi:hypothetical protein